MLQLISVLNVLLLLIGTFWTLVRIFPAVPMVLLSLIAPVLLLMLLSYCYFLSLVFHWPFYVLSGLLLLLNAMHSYRSIPWLLRVLFPGSDARREGPGAREWVVLAVGLAISTFFFGRYVERWGTWDAWAIWNLHAKFLFYPDSWTQLFSRSIAYTHPDYPLMLPSLIAYGWRSVGAIGPIVPAVIAWLPLVLIPGVLFYSLYGKGLKMYAYLSLALIVSNLNFTGLASSQLADSMLALVMLMSFVVFQQPDEVTPRLPYLMGCMAASASWIKNEGEMFYLIFSMMYVFFYRRKRMTILQYALGSLLPLVILALFKLGYASSNYLFEERKGTGVLALLTDFSRYWLIVKNLFGALLSDFGPLVILVILAFVLGSHYPSFGGWVLLLLLGCYGLVYVITPFDLQWHMETSQDRLLLQLYPSCLYLSLNHLRNFSWKLPDVRTKSSQL